MYSDYNHIGDKGCKFIKGAEWKQLKLLQLGNTSKTKTTMKSQHWDANGWQRVSGPSWRNSK